VDGRGRYLTPGLWDMHVHFGGGPELIDENKALLPLYIAYGITTVRDCSGDLAQEVLSWRGAIAAGTLLGPTLLSSGPKIEGIHPVWKGTLETGSRADVDAAIVRLKDLQVDFVKITDNTLDPQLFLYAVGRARAAGFKVSGHIPMALTVHQAVEPASARSSTLTMHSRRALRMRRPSPAILPPAASIAMHRRRASMQGSMRARR